MVLAGSLELPAAFNVREILLAFAANLLEVVLPLDRNDHPTHWTCSF